MREHGVVVPEDPSSRLVPVRKARDRLNLIAHSPRRFAERVINVVHGGVLSHDVADRFSKKEWVRPRLYHRGGRRSFLDVNTRRSSGRNGRLVTVLYALHD